MNQCGDCCSSVIVLFVPKTRILFGSLVPPSCSRKPSPFSNVVYSSGIANVRSVGTGWTAFAFCLVDLIARLMMRRGAICTAAAWLSWCSSCPKICCAASSVSSARRLIFARIYNTSMCASSGACECVFTYPTIIMLSPILILALHTDNPLPLPRRCSHS